MSVSAVLPIANTGAFALIGPKADESETTAPISVLPSLYPIASGPPAETPYKPIGPFLTPDTSCPTWTSARIAASVEATFCRHGIRGRAPSGVTNASAGVNVQQPTRTTKPAEARRDAAETSPTNTPELPCNQTTRGNAPEPCGRRTAATWTFLLLPPAPSIFTHCAPGTTTSFGAVVSLHLIDAAVAVGELATFGLPQAARPSERPSKGPIQRFTSSSVRLALDRAARRTPDEVLLEEDHEDDDRHCVEHRAGEHPVPVHSVKS